MILELTIEESSREEVLNESDIIEYDVFDNNGFNILSFDIQGNTVITFNISDGTEEMIELLEDLFSENFTEAQESLLYNLKRNCIPKNNMDYYPSSGLEGIYCSFF